MEMYDLIKQVTIKIKGLKQYPGGAIFFQKIRDDYLAIPCNGYGVIFVDKNLEIIKELKLSSKTAIGDIYIKQDETEIILNCLDINGYLVKINLLDFSHQIIKFAKEDHEVWLSKIYLWNDDFIVLVGCTGFLIKVTLVNSSYEFINHGELNELNPTFVKLLRHMKKNCKSHPLIPRIKHNLRNIYYVDLKRYIYVCIDQEDQQIYVIDYVKNEKMVLSNWDDSYYTFDYKYEFFITTGEYTVRGFYNQQSIFSLNDINRVYFGAKLFQDLQQRYIYILDGCTKTNADVVLTKYLISEKN